MNFAVCFCIYFRQAANALLCSVYRVIQVLCKNMKPRIGKGILRQ